MIDGHILAGTLANTIHVTEYGSIASSPERGDLSVTGDVTLNDLSTTIIETQSAVSAGGQLDVGGNMHYAGTFEFRVNETMNLDNEAIVVGGSATFGAMRVDILNLTGAADLGALLSGKLVLPELQSGNFTLGLTDATGSLATAGTITGTSANDALLGSTGDDVLISGAGGDELMYGLGGNDAFTLSASSDAAYVDGGSGTDILYVEKTDFGQTENWRFNNFEALDVSGAGTGTIAISQDFALGVTEDSNALLDAIAGLGTLAEDALVIAGDTGQTLQLSDNANWTATGSTVSVDHDSDGGTDSYAIYSASNGSNVFVDTDMNVQLGAPQ